MYSAAYAGLSEACTALGYTTFLPAPEASRAALEAAERAVTLDASLPEGHTALGWTKTLFAIDMRTAERDFQRALEIAPGYAPAHGYYALLLCGFGRFDEAIDHAMQARHHDPLWMMMPFIMSQVLICARRFEEPNGRCATSCRSIPTSPAVTGISSALAGQGRLDEAIEVQEKGVSLVRRAPFFVALLALVLPEGRATRRKRCARSSSTAAAARRSGWRWSAASSARRTWRSNTWSSPSRSTTIRCRSWPSITASTACATIRVLRGSQKTRTARADRTS